MPYLERESRQEAIVAVWQEGGPELGDREGRKKWASRSRWGGEMDGASLTVLWGWGRAWSQRRGPTGTLDPCKDSNHSDDSELFSFHGSLQFKNMISF